ncbi:uncharacterized protein DSM5745_08902 [Aspergillus mulundensis]|uniref:Chromosome transmission fidelity protein 4 n=1 Tax=Aspergillus mulundensis TaxID=1810919 RepID=A0A3D8R500_9EURO|nr:Uncharacterized protein DSM5745_08902 [Aspergillus mulundensis]RDW69142.1 Uncharacterized protein DSM5745_08902 [Aspergillus mulundensis]
MPKLAVPRSPTSVSSRIIRFYHPRPHARSASSHSPIRHDIPRSPAQTHLPLLPSRPGSGFDFKYSLTDDLNPPNDHKPPDERVIKLGKTLRTLSPLLPTILTNPLPPHILSPSVTLHLFPSTHPHLPTVKGRTLYRAALWAVPVAWSSVPLVGNVKLQILSERIVRGGAVRGQQMDSAHVAPKNGDSGDERLVVRWRTERTQSTSTPSTPPPSEPRKPDAGTRDESKTNTNKGLSVLLGGDAPIFKPSRDDQFTGLFIFSFDEEGRVLTQTIEHAEDAGGWERTAKFVTLTDWLIGKARGSLDAPQPAGLCCSGAGAGQEHKQDRYQQWRGDEGGGRIRMSTGSGSSL